MLKIFKPTWMVKSIYRISPEKLKAHGINVILTDLDNTLIPWNDATGTDRILQWIEKMHECGIKIIVISNNSPKRVSLAVKNLKLPFIANALKPLGVGVKKALRKYHLKRSQVVMVGDQMMTDILVANTCKIASIWVKPLTDTDQLPTRINRTFESFIFLLLKKKYPDLKWEEDID